MTTVKQLIEFLQTCPQDSSVQVLNEVNYGEIIMVDLDISCCSFVNCIKNGYLQNKAIVQLWAD
jgi:hypothetical protein